MYPSRLLFYLEDDKFVESCDLIFSNKLDEDMNYADEDKMSYPKYNIEKRLMTKRRVSVSAFKSYLTCPFYFYLEKVLNTNLVDDRSFEITPAQNGTILHKAMEFFASYDCQILDIYSQYDYIMERLKITLLQNYFGNTQNSLIEIQVANMSKSIENFLHCHEEFLTQKNDLKIYAEKKFEVKFWELEEKFNLPSLKDSKLSDIIFTGSIDRIDEYIDEDGCKVYNIVDYKTSKSAKTPQETHFKSITKNSDEDEKLFFAYGDEKKEYSFIELQLPLYVAMLKSNLTDIKFDENAKIVSYYCNLSSTKESCQYLPIFFSDELLENAVKLARLIIERIYLENKFWPPKMKNTIYADYLEILHKPTDTDFEFAKEEIN